MASELPLLLGGVGLVKGSVKNFGLALRDLCHEVAADMATQGFLASAPFRCVHLIVRYGQESKEHPQLGRINRFGELEASVQMSLDELRSAHGDVHTLKSRMLPYVRKALDVVASKYGLAAMPSNTSLERTREG